MHLACSTGSRLGHRMNAPRPVIDISALKRVEEVYRSRLQQEPGDLTARTGLAWCLFSQALHQAGKESVLDRLAPESSGDEAARAAADPDARRVLKECLRQTVAVLQLSRTPAEQEEAERLQDLIRASAGDEAVSEVEQEASRMLAELAQAVLQHEIPARRRTVTRRRLR